MELTGRWLDRLCARVDLPANRVFPTDELLDHMPLLISGVADHLEDPTHGLEAKAPVVQRAMELGALRYQQGFDEYEILKEFEILGGILFTFVTDAATGFEASYPADELFACANRLFRALTSIQQAAIAHYLQLMRHRLTEREERLRAFNRALTHEFRNRIGAAMGAGQLLEFPELGAEERSRLTGVVVRNMQSMRVVLENLLELTRGEIDVRQQRHVRLPQAVAEAARHQREMAAARGVVVDIAPDLPDVEVYAAALELALTNLISNGIKYACPTRPHRWVKIEGFVSSSEDGVPCELTIDVRDNGIGVPESQQARLFQRLFRATNAEATAVEGTGLGLSIVREALDAFGGRISAESSTEGSRFRIVIPCRRASDHAALKLSAPNAPQLS
jgi:signal transduction histidine kinase